MTEIRYTRSTHAPLFERYRNGDYHKVGDQLGDYSRETSDGTELRALGGRDHRYSTDLKVGSSYPETGFIVLQEDIEDGDDELVYLTRLEGFLKDHDIWSGKLRPVLLPAGMHEWAAAFQYRPPSEAPSFELLRIRWAKNLDGAEKGGRVVYGWVEDD